MKKLLLVIDMQVDFVTGVLGSPAAAGIVAAVRQRVEAYQSQGHPVLFTMDTHREEDYQTAEKSREAERIPPHCIAGSDGWQLVGELRPLAGENTLEKPAFLASNLAEVIRGRWGEVSDIELCGVCTDICVVSNALFLREAFPAARIRVDAACCAGTSPENHGAALAVMGSCLIEVS